MKSEDIDWKILRGSSIIFVLTLVISGSLVFGSHYFRQQMQQEFARANAEFRSISSRYLAVDEEEKLIKNYFPQFIKLYEEGIIGSERRLNWVEVLRESGDEIRLPSLVYQIDSQQVFTPAFPLTMGKFKLYSSTMSLNMQLLHEGDLFRILDRLDEDARGSFSLSTCTIKKSGSEIMINPEAANISATCDLQWYSIRLADGTIIEV